MMRPVGTLLLTFTYLASFTAVRGQGVNQPVGPISSWPHDYPGKPEGDFSPAWQDYFEVKDPLPNVTFPVTRSFAGNIGVNRAGHPNNTLFFWAFEKENGSLTVEDSTEPWGIWLNGGPGSSSMLGLLFENGPIHINGDYSESLNEFSWDRLADYVWIDQPVGTGWATADLDGFVQDEDQMGLDFWGFVENIVKVFPSLQNRPLYLTGESYAGTYIPYITKAYFSLSNPPTTLAKIVIGDGSLASNFVVEELPTVTTIETYPQLIGYDPVVYEYFREQSHLCGYDLNLTYPQDGHFPTLSPFIPAIFGDFSERVRPFKKFTSKKALLADAKARYKARAVDAGSLRKRAEDQKERKRDLIGRANGTLDPFYGCALLEEMIDYALNFSLPWSLNGDEGFNAFDVYQIPDALFPESPLDAIPFLDNDVTRAAIHAPTSKDWFPSVNYPFGGPDGEDPSIEPMAFLSELATNASVHNIPFIFYSGNDDSLVSHRGTEVVIQNMTFGGIQGFTRKPSTPWFDDSGNFAGIVHQERNLTFVLFDKAGHQVPLHNPANAFIFLREFVLGNNRTGLVVDVKGATTVVGGESSSLFVNNVLPGQSGVFVGSGATQSTYTYPLPTVAAWDSFISIFLATPTGL